MTTNRRMLSVGVLAGLLGLVLLALLISPAAETGGEFSSYSAGPDGERLAYDLAGRLGWRMERREVPFSDSLENPAHIQVVVAARIAAPEARALLAHVRDGGSLLVIGDAAALSDLLPTRGSTPGEPARPPRSAGCKSVSVWESQIERYNEFRAIAWRRPAPPDTVGFGDLVVRRGSSSPAHRRAAVGYPLGKGRVVIVADRAFTVNDVLRRCEYEADVIYVRALEYLSQGQTGVRVAFDEYHHGYGVHGGSMTAIRMYLGGTASGRMLAQMSIAGVLLLFAAAPRPLAPRDPARVARRSPLEHADALAHAYAGVKATRTATARLLAGVRRRARRDRAKSRESDEQLLANAVAVSPAAAEAAAVVARALETPIAERELRNVAAAVSTIESALTARTTSPTR